MMLYQGIVVSQNVALQIEQVAGTTMWSRMLPLEVLSVTETKPVVILHADKHCTVPAFTSSTHCVESPMAPYCSTACCAPSGSWGGGWR